MTLTELENNKSIFFSITQSLNTSDHKNQKVFSFSSDKKESQSVKSEDILSGKKECQQQPSNLPSVAKKKSLKNENFTFDLIKKKIQEKTIEEPYKGAHLSNEKGENMKEKLQGEVNKFLWLIFHDLNLKGGK